MKLSNEREFKLLGTPVSQGNFTCSERAIRSLKSFIRLFRPRYDITRLNARLRRDAGIDELELERTNCARAPLIR